MLFIFLRTVQACFGLLLVLSVPVAWGERSGPPQPIIIDTDVDVDDLTAIAYLLREPLTTIKAITVVSTGWADQVPAGTNVRRLTAHYGCPGIPVGVGGYNGFTRSTDDHSNWIMPNPDFKTDVNNVFTFYNNKTQCAAPYLPPNPLGFSPLTAADLIIYMLKTSDVPVDFLLLGPFTNLAEALKKDYSIIDKIGTVYLSGGDLNTWEIPSTREDELNGPRFPYTELTEGATWNVWLDPYAVHYVIMSLQALPSPPKFVTITEQSQNTLPMSPDPFQGRKKKVLKDNFIPDFVRAFATCGGVGQGLDAFMWWDESAALMMRDIIAGNTSSVCTEWVYTPVMMNLNNGPKFGQMFQHATGLPMHLCVKMNKTAYLERWWADVEEEKEALCPVEFDYDFRVLAQQPVAPAEPRIPPAEPLLLPGGMQPSLALFGAMAACSAALGMGMALLVLLAFDVAGTRRAYRLAAAAVPAGI